MGRCVSKRFVVRYIMFNAKCSNLCLKLFSSIAKYLVVYKQTIK